MGNRSTRLWLIAGVWAAHLLASRMVSAQESEKIPLERFKPIYFLLGRPHAKIQISFKVQLLRNTPVFFAYSQLLIGDLLVADPGFRDVNYNPEVFYRLRLSPESENGFDFSPYEHESNGKGGEFERAWDRAYIRYHADLAVTDNRRLFWAFKAWVPLYFKPANQDLAQFRGLWELGLTISVFQKESIEDTEFSLRLYPGGKLLIDPSQGGQELTFVSKVCHSSFVPRFVAQLFHGHGENLIDYRENRMGFRLGLGF